MMTENKKEIIGCKDIEFNGFGTFYTVNDGDDVVFYPDEGGEKLARITKTCENVIWNNDTYISDVNKLFIEQLFEEIKLLRGLSSESYESLLYFTCTLAQGLQRQHLVLQRKYDIEVRGAKLVEDDEINLLRISIECCERNIKHSGEMLSNMRSLYQC